MSDYRCPQHQPGMPDAQFYYLCDDCQASDILEPGDIDQYGNRYYRYDEWLDAA